jgi:hypothetical protein
MLKGITEIVSARRAAAELKQKLKGKRNDGMGDYTSIVYGIDIAGKKIELKDLNDIQKFKIFGLTDKL